METSELEKILQHNRATVSSDLDAVTTTLLELADVQRRFQILKGTPAFTHKHQEILEAIQTFSLNVFRASRAFANLRLGGVTILTGVQELEQNENTQNNPAGG